MSQSRSEIKSRVKVCV